MSSALNLAYLSNVLSWYVYPGPCYFLFVLLKPLNKRFGGDFEGWMSLVTPYLAALSCNYGVKYFPPSLLYLLQVCGGGLDPYHCAGVTMYG